MGYRNYWIGVGTLILLFGLIVFSMLGDEKAGVLPAGVVSMGGISQQLQNIQLVSLRGVTEDLVLRADSAEIRNHDPSLYLEKLEITRKTSGDLPLKITGDSGIMNIESRDLQILGQGKPVIITLGNRYRLETESLSWIDDRKEVHTQEKVYFSGPDIRLEGVGLIGKVERGEYEIGKPVHAVMDR